ncbi:MAG: DUF4412 domain-containing protein, partial [Flavobacteriaceae bacterium]|nr:DUF4412 domain-containing protein [Flavobacteriaceae bacterium]
MKKSVIILTVITSLLCSKIEAQFLERLTKRVQEAAEETAIMKAEEKAAGETSKAADKLLNVNLNKMMKSGAGSSVDPSILPESYDFDWKYTMQMQTKEGSFIIIYYLKPDVKYFASKPDMKQSGATGDMYTVMDMDRNINIIFMDMNGQRMAMASSIPMDLDFEDEGSVVDEYTFKEIGTKEIMGYTCQGFTMENSEIKMTIYAAMEAPVSFSQIFGMKTDKAPKGFNPKWLDKMENSLVMEVQYQDKKKKKNSLKMR